MLEIPLSLGNPSTYKDCLQAQFKCGNISAGYPFSGDGIPLGCGHAGLKLVCDYETNTTTIEIGQVIYQVLEILPSDNQTLRIAGSNFIKNDSCNPAGFENWIPGYYGPLELVNSSDYATIILLYGCQNSIQTSLGHFNCSGNGDSYKDFWVVFFPEVTNPMPCSANVTVPIKHRPPLAEIPSYSWLIQYLQEGFYVKWKEDSGVCETCKQARGACGLDAENRPTCYCPNATDTRDWEELKECRSLAPYAGPTPPAGEGKNKNGVSLPIGLGIAGGATAAGIFLGLGILCFRLKRRDLPTPPSWKRPPIATASVEAFIVNFGSLAPKRYSYRNIKKMTNKFKDKLGQGGYGSVYKGKLSDGRLVAVKVLSESKGHGEDFMNEVASIGRTSHVNIVTLLGFCYDRSKRALVYEFMALGSLDKYIYNWESDDQSRQLEWKTLYDTALDIARGLEYLHQGCNTRILHFDIKPHNILLDENFCPKISDFGLSKLCERKESIVSMTGARGTAGYIAPEVFSRSFGVVSYKSDVYSYGMMLLEMVGGRKNIETEVSQYSEIYFPSWIYKRIDQAMNLSLHGVTAEDEEITRKMIVVSLWCIQTNPSDRPSMSKVLEMLQGSLESLVIPPRPFLSSPERCPKSSSETSSVLIKD
ncbi:hypothetical protein PTKIN_Ptkin12aG0049800 [Pterospermum kingtungense]